MSGYTVFEARNGEEAVRVADAEQPQLILMDLSLPLIDGLAATRPHTPSWPASKQIPIIAVSAHDTADFHSKHSRPDAMATLQADATLRNWKNWIASTLARQNAG